MTTDAERAETLQRLMEAKAALLRVGGREITDALVTPRTARALVRELEGMGALAYPADPEDAPAPPPDVPTAKYLGTLDGVRVWEVPAP